MEANGTNKIKMYARIYFFTPRDLHTYIRMVPSYYKIKVALTQTVCEGNTVTHWQKGQVNIPLLFKVKFDNF